ncbi:MAG: hypothetical protein Tsb0013_14160 [Phycisphaerales bacterium]
MNTHTLVAGLVLAIGSNAVAGSFTGSASINVDVLAVNGTPQMTTGTVDTVGVQPGDTILFAINGEITGTAIPGDFIQFAIIRLAPVGEFGFVDPGSITLAPALESIISSPRVFDDPDTPTPNDDNGLNLQTFRLPGAPDSSLGTGGQLFTFEFTVTADAGEFSYDTLVVPGPTDPENRLVAGGPDFNKYLITETTADRIVIPSPSAIACFGLVGGFAATRRRRA